MHDEDYTIDRVNRILDLLDSETPKDVIRAAVNRSTDGLQLGAMIGLIEDIQWIKENEQVSE